MLSSFRSSLLSGSRLLARTSFHWQRRFSGSTKPNGFFAWYTKQLDEKPLTTKIVSSALIAASGDVICQKIERKASFDWHRTGRFFLIGAFWVAPATHFWYGFLSTRLVPGKATPIRVVQRLALDQLGAAPVFCPTFMGLLWLLEGKKSPKQVWEDLVEAGPTLVTSNWKLWIPAMGVMFTLVPLKFQVVYSNFVGLVWTVYLSYASTRLGTQERSAEG